MTKIIDPLIEFNKQNSRIIWIQNPSLGSTQEKKSPKLRGILLFGGLVGELPRHYETDASEAPNRFASNDLFLI